MNNQPVELTEMNILDIDQVTKDILATIDTDREKEIISRRFGLFERKETLEQIGEMLGITRERVRQLEKAILSKLKAMAHKDLPHIKSVEQIIMNYLKEHGEVARVSNITASLSNENTKLDQSRIAFLAELCPNLSVIEDNDFYHLAVANKAVHDEDKVKELVNKIIAGIKELNQPVTIEVLAKKLKSIDNKKAHSLATISKSLSTLHDRWGLIKWPLVNPKNIRDKIYVVLHKNNKPMHFNEISGAIKEAEFKRNNVTTQAIHNELIKDKRFVLIGRGIYALKEWGYENGTVSDVITTVLKEAGKPLHRDDIVRLVLDHRQVKVTTILLNIQGKPQFKRVSKATYTLDESLIPQPKGKRQMKKKTTASK